MNYIKIDNCNMNNGSGLRCVIWVSGCEHHCKNCFNPETWDANVGSEFGEKEQNMICDTLSQDWCSGITLTGGDPLSLANIWDTMRLIDAVKKAFPNKNIWVYTGSSWDTVKRKPGIENIDVLVDGEYIDECKSPDKHWVGSSNQNVIDVKASMKENKLVLWKEG